MYAVKRGFESRATPAHEKPPALPEDHLLVLYYLYFSKNIEYPEALKNNKKILPIEMVPTDKKELFNQ
ncbi:MAG: hypothetical protein IJG49_05130 [Erysipelotrichaceae bacterium]|nr:hypothetical protein [Erysipelotrichaceae bacterium]